MKRFVCLVSVLLIAACAQNVAEFWRPISEPNLLMSQSDAQKKLDFDLSQCRCGIFPSNVSPVEQVQFQPDKRRLAETSVTVTQKEEGDCMLRPSLVVAECMRARGWEVTKCSGRMPLASGGSLCAGAVLD